MLGKTHTARLIHLHKVLDMRSKIICVYFSESGMDGLHQDVMNQNVLLFNLYHKISILSQRGDIFIDIHCFLCSNAAQHCVYHNECTSSAHPGTAVNNLNENSLMIYRN